MSKVFFPNLKSFNHPVMSILVLTYFDFFGKMCLKIEKDYVRFIFRDLDCKAPLINILVQVMTSIASDKYIL